MLKIVRFVLIYALLPLVLITTAALTWLRWDAGRPLSAYFADRQGALADVEFLEAVSAGSQSSEYLTLRSDSGLAVSLRIIRKGDAGAPLPVLMILGGHRTGRDAVDLFGDVGELAVVALDYPYDGPKRVRGIRQSLRAIPPARRGFRDMPPAVSLVVDWLSDQAWADQDQLIIVGVSLGVPFATLAAARDRRIDAAILVHGAADNQAWLEIQVARRNESRLLLRPLATIYHWLAYGPTFDTARNVALISPRPVVIIGAREDERTPAGQTEALYAAAGEPKLLRWTKGQHVQPNRIEIIAELLQIISELVPIDAAK